MTGEAQDAVDQIRFLSGERDCLRMSPDTALQRDLPPSRNGNFAAGEALQEQQQQRSIRERTPPHIRRSTPDPLDRHLAGQVDSLGGW